MTYIELDEQQRGLTRSQTINSVVIILAAMGMLGLALLMRNSSLSATQIFVDEVKGIRAQLPANWLIARNGDDFIVQAQDPGAVPHKTLLQISALPVGSEATPRNVVDTLTLQRAERLSFYRVLSIQPILLGEVEALEMNYAYVQDEGNPFLNAVPLVVQGRDVVVIRQGEALIFTYREENSRFEEHERLFDTFIDTLEF
jgi:hypothetical protein